MNKSELVASMAEKSGLTKKDAESALNALMDSVMEALEKKEKVQLVGFGTFEAVDRAARTGRNPMTQEEIQIPASVVPKFSAGKDFKERVGVVKTIAEGINKGAKIATTVAMDPTPDEVQVGAKKPGKSKKK